jgi:HAE1 family hydrophobic/amphiphilic exporter-1
MTSRLSSSIRSIHEVRNDALIGGTLAVLMIFFFLGDGRSTFVISLSLAHCR